MVLEALFDAPYKLPSQIRANLLPDFVLDVELVAILEQRK